MNTADALYSSEAKQEAVLSRFGIEITNNRHTYCPMCERTDKKTWRVNYSRTLGRFGCICTCGSYDPITIIQRVSGLDIGTLLREIDGIIGNSPVKPTVTQEKTKSQLAVEKFKSGVPLSGTPAQKYLAGRGIHSLPTGGAVYLEREPFYDDSGKVKCYYGAIFCIASDELGKPTYSHTTYLNGDAKAQEGGQERKQRSLIDARQEPTASIKLRQKQEVMAIGEGIESCLAFTEVRGIPAHATLNTTLMKRYRCDSDVTHLIICADNDWNGAGLAAAYHCANANILQRKNLQRVTIQWPATRGTDFNDALISSDGIMEDYVCKRPK